MEEAYKAYNIPCYFILLFFLAIPHGMWDFKFPNQKLNLCPAVEAWSLNHRLPGKSPFHVILAVEILVKQLAQ